MSMKSTRIILILAVVMIAAAVLPAAALSDDYTQPDPASVAGAWWDHCPPVKVIKQTRVVYRQAETLIESIPAEGYCYTVMKRVNVRSQPSIYATKVMTIKSAGTEFIVTARTKNSAGEIWYAVELANGTLGYIRSDLLNTDHVILMGDPYAYESWVGNRDTAASESGAAWQSASATAASMARMFRGLVHMCSSHSASRSGSSSSSSSSSMPSPISSSRASTQSIRRTTRTLPSRDESMASAHSSDSPPIITNTSALRIFNRSEGVGS